MLKPGGIYIFVEHVAANGTKLNLLNDIRAINLLLQK